MRHHMKHLAVTLGVLCALSATTASAHEFGFFNSYWDPDNSDASPGLAIRYGHRFTEHWAVDVRWYWYFDVSPSKEYSVEPTFISLGPSYVGRMTETISWYLSGAASVWWIEQEENEENEEQIYDYGVIALGGLEKEIAESWSLFADIHYIWVEPELEREQVGSGLKEDVNMDGHGFSFGLLYRW